MLWWCAKYFPSVKPIHSKIIGKKLLHHTQVLDFFFLLGFDYF